MSDSKRRGARLNSFHIELLQSIVQPHDAVVHIESAWSSRHQLKKFAEMKRIVASNLDSSRHEYKERRLRGRRLHIHGFHNMVDLSNLFEFSNDSLWSCELLSLKRHHWLRLLQYQNEQGIWWERQKYDESNLLSFDCVTANVRKLHRGYFWLFDGLTKRPARLSAFESKDW